jgi:ribosome-associated protein
MTPPFRRPPARNDLPTDGEAAGARPSKTRLKHEMEALQELGETLVSLDAARLRSLDLPERLVDAVVLARGITKHEARRRQMQYLGRLMRDVDPVPIRAALERWETVPREEKARFAALEGWRDRILADAAALDAFVAEHPDADRASLARLADAARNERSRGEPPRAFRELFRAMRRATGNI